MYHIDKLRNLALPIVIFNWEDTDTLIMITALTHHLEQTMTYYPIFFSTLAVLCVTIASYVSHITK